MNYHATLTLLLAFIPLAAQADVFRCTNVAGKVEYSDSPCVGGTGRTVTVDQNVIPGSAERALRKENQRLRKELDASKQPAAAPIPATSAGIGRTEADLAAEKGGSIECARAKRNYEVATSSIQIQNVEPVVCGVLELSSRGRADVVDLSNFRQA